MTKKTSNPHPERENGGGKREREREPHCYHPLVMASSPPSSPSFRQSTFLPADREVSEEKRDHQKKKQLTLIPLIFLIFFNISGAPYGEKPATQVAGPPRPSSAS